MKKLWNRIRQWLLKKLGADDYKNMVLIERCDKNTVKLCSTYKQSIFDNTPREFIIERLAQSFAEQITEYMMLNIASDDYTRTLAYRAELEVVVPIRRVEYVSNYNR